MKHRTPSFFSSGTTTGLSRRTFLTSAGAAGLGLYLQPKWGFSQAGRHDSPHFFLNVCISGGMDATYLFDARPLEFTDRGFLQNYLYRNAASGSEVLPDPRPLRYTGTNGQSALRSPLTNNLIAYQPYFSVINGVMMSPDFNGHGSNMYYFFGNSATGPADSFVPIIGATKPTAPLQSIHFGGWEGDGNRAPTNFGSSVQLGAGQGQGLAAALDATEKINLDASFYRHLRQRMEALGTGEGLFSAGSRKLSSGFARAPGLRSTLESVVISGDDGEEGDEGAIFLKAVDGAFAYFQNNVTNAITIMYDRDPDIDVHAASGAQEQLALYREITDNLTTLFEKLTTTPFDEDKGLSMLDVTTVAITTEFSRTMRQDDSPIDNTGTDHNQYTNTVILAGKGVKPGMIIGESDCQFIDETGTISDVSAAHRQKDPGLKMIMGKPFDFETARPRQDLAASFSVGDYLGSPSIVNTLMRMFEVEENLYFKVGAVSAPVIDSLLA